jgi:hypothetical protein
MTANPRFHALRAPVPLLAALLVVLLAFGIAHASAQSDDAAPIRHEMLSDEHLERMEAHLTEMLERVQQMRATDDLSQRRRLMMELRDEMQAMHQDERGRRMCPMCPMMEGMHGPGMPGRGMHGPGPRGGMSPRAEGGD